MNSQILRAARRLPRKPLPLPQMRHASKQSLYRQLFPAGTPSQPTDWYRLARHAWRTASLYAPMSMVLFWPYPVYKIAEALV
ncbi:hypothetical protein BKA67DRAFT_209162 [Truncatella angustata]|uniref:Uncharacterized protein n=1 Tax=Truncatella angustata TaxID=152316 RepID=A0A9P8UTT0_9PEZI|nr:uncharacterized protein BKA67DRAFT_209162 [Truncatella angustata]KAH6658229.1 hypothetical protein BKA67DRAFT_209162 [Truncatella angustata]